MIYSEKLLKMLPIPIPPFRFQYICLFRIESVQVPKKNHVNESLEKLDFMLPNASCGFNAYHHVIRLSVT